MQEKKYIIGIGCRRGVSCGDIAAAVFDVLRKNSISEKSIKGLASVDLKSDEKGLLEFSDKCNLEIEFFTRDELESVETPNPSDKVLEKVGITSVCEAAAKFACQGEIIVEKQKYGNVTVAVCG